MNTTPLSSKNLKQNQIPFAFTAAAARQVSLAGDFNNWDAKATVNSPRPAFDGEP